MALTKITRTGITDGSIGADQIEDGTIIASDIEDGAITNAKLANSAFTLNGSSVSLGGSVSVSAFVNWQSVQTTSFTAVAGNGYFCNTTSSAITVTLPASPSAGDTIAIKDYAGTFGTNNLTIGRNSENIQGVANNSVLSTNRAAVTLVYMDSTKGWLFTEESNVGSLGQALFTSATGGTITTSGDFKIHSFTGDGCFVASQVGNSPIIPTGGPSNVDYLVIAGGGGGGSSQSAGARGAGGAGAGGYRTTFPSPGCNAGAFPISATTYPITVGAGGAAGSTGGDGSSGSNSIFSSITSAGGGGGGGTTYSNGVSGGSGGGATSTGTAGSGNTPPVSPSQGNPGGAKSGGLNVGSAGGGGAGGSGGNFTIPGTNNAADSGAGGAGSANSITGSSVTRAGGGGGGAAADAVTDQGAGGSGGGGAGATLGGTAGGSGTANTGSAGGGAADTSSGPGNNGGAGGKGIVIIRYKYQ